MVQASMFKKASAVGRWLKMSVQGPSGSGKTTLANRVSKGIVEREGGRVALIDSEDGRALLEAGRFDFDHCDLRDLRPDRQIVPESYVQALKDAARAKYTVTIIDSLSHEWEAILRMKDDLPYKEQFTGWAKVNPHHEAVFRAMLEYPGHLIVTLRSKMEHVIDPRTGAVEKKGMAPVMRDRSEYEFDLAFELDLASKCTLAKRPRGIFHVLDKYSKTEPGEELGHIISDALRGVNAKAAPDPKVAVPAPTPAKTENALEERARLREELLTLEVLFGGRAKMLGAAGREWPKTLEEARETLRLAKAAHEAALSFDPAPDDAGAIPFDEGAASASGPDPGSRGKPTAAAPPPIHAGKPGDGSVETRTKASRKKAPTYMLKDAWAILLRLGVGKEELPAVLEIYGQKELAKLSPDDRDDLIEQMRIRAIPRVDKLRTELGMQPGEIDELCMSLFDEADPKRLDARQLGDLLKQLAMGVVAVLEKSPTATLKDVMASVDADVPY